MIRVKSAKTIPEIKKVIKAFWKKPVNTSKVKKISIEQVWFYLEENNKKIGFINGHIIDAGFSKAANIDNLYIEKKYRGKGYSKKLLEKVIDYCKKKKVNEIDLRVEKKNKKARNLYKKFKFKEDKSGLLMHLYFK